MDENNVGSRVRKSCWWSVHKYERPQSLPVDFLVSRELYFSEFFSQDSVGEWRNAPAEHACVDTKCEWTEKCRSILPFLTSIFLFIKTLRVEFSKIF